MNGVHIMTIAELIEDWMVNHEQERIKAQTYSRYRGLIDLHILPALGEAEIHNLTRRQIHDFLTEKKREGNKCTGGSLSATSVNLMLSIFNMAFEYAYDLEMVTANPCDRLKRIPSTDGKKVEAFTRAEQRKIEQAINSEDDDRQDRLFGIVLCLYSGLRIGELMALEWTDLNEDCTILTVSKTVYRDKGSIGVWQLCVDNPKTKSSNRRIPLPPHISERLSELRTKSKSKYIVANKKNERMSTRSYQYIFEKLTERAGVRKLNFHALRHTFATRVLECGMDIKTLSEIMGHKNATVTLNRYAHSQMDTKIEMMSRLTPII